MAKENKLIKNAMWIIGCRIVRAVLNVFVTMLTARCFGPSNYGLINYAASVVAFVAPVMMLGLDTTLVQEFVEKPEQKGCTLGTALGMNLLSALACMAGIAAFVAIANPGEKTTLIVCVLYSLNLPLQVLEMTQYWFQAELKSKYTSATMLLSYILVSLYKIYLLVTEKGVYWFAVSQAIDYFIISVVLLIIYHRIGGQKLRFSFRRGKEMLSRSRYYIISSLMITIFAQTDKIMLKMMVGDEAVGYYSAAVLCAGMTGFVFSAIIDSAKPIVWEARKKSKVLFERNMTMLYSVVIFLALAQSAVITVLAELVVLMLYGIEYLQSVQVLRIVVWYTTFSYLGAARTVWILGEEKHDLLWKVNLYGALANVLLNYLLIPTHGAAGAAIASLATQIFTNFLVGFMIPALRDTNKLIIRALNPCSLIRGVRELLKKE